MATLKALTVSIDVNANSVHECLYNPDQKVFMNQISKEKRSCSGAFVPEISLFTSHSVGTFLFFVSGRYIYRGGIYENELPDYRLKRVLPFDGRPRSKA